MNVLQEIFRDHFEEIQYILHPRPIVMTTIDKMIHCGDAAYGGAMYGCPKCGLLKFVPFCERLIRHIPDKHFKMIRYYGIYARHRDSDKLLRPALSFEKKKFLLSYRKWRICILASFGYDPLECPDCGTKMLFQNLYCNHKRVSLQNYTRKRFPIIPDIMPRLSLRNRFT